MSLYNMLMGVNPFAEVATNYLFGGVIPNNVYRFRDVFFEEDGTKIVLFCRIGGGNREEYAEIIERFRTHPVYIRDWDDSFDSTFCYFEFRVLEKYVEYFKEIASLTDRQMPMDRFLKAMKDFDSGVKNEQTDQIEVAGKKIVEQLTSAIESGQSGEVKYGEGSVKIIGIKPNDKENN